MYFDVLQSYSVQVYESLETEEKRLIGKHNEEEKKKQENLLIQKISRNNPYLEDKIAVYNNECAFGKSYIALKGAIKYIIDSQEKYFDGMLYVCELTENCKKNAETINNWYKDYAKVEQDVAIAIEPTSMTRKQIESYLETYSFVFITHSKYRKLILNLEDRLLYTDRRGLLIIDEYIDLVQPVEFSKTYNALLKKDVKYLGGKQAVAIYDKITRELNEEIQILDNLRDVAREEKDPEKRKKLQPKNFEFFNSQKRVEEIRKLLEKLTEIIKEYSSQQKLADYQKNNDFTSIFDKLKELENFYLGTATEEYSYNKHTNKLEQLILVPSYNLQPFLLKNTILLDASADLNLIYKYQSNIYKIIPQEKIFDHSNFTIKHLRINGTKSAQKSKYLNYEEASRKIVKKLRNEQNDEFEKTLVVTIKDRCVNKNNEQVYVYQIPEEENFVSYYEVLKSNNGFKDYQNCFLETLYIPTPSLCILKYLYFTRKRLETGDLDVTFKNNGGVGRFRSDKLEEIRKYEIANFSYQAIKRINRDMLLKDCKIVWNCHYSEVVEIIKNMMLNCKCETDLELEKYYVEKPQNIDEDSHLGKIMNFCNDILNNKIPQLLQDKLKKDGNIITFQKKNIYEYLDITKTPFSRVLSDERFIEYALNKKQIIYIISKDKTVNVTDDFCCNNRQIKFILKS